MGGSDITYNPPTPMNYGESMQDALEAQVRMAPALFRAESDANYGRPAYARLEQQIAKNALLGRQYRSGGQNIRYEDGLVDLIGGTQDATFYNEDGLTEQRQVGFDEDKNFLGVAQFEQDLRQREIRNRVNNELGLVTDFGDRATQLYRQQGRLGENLARANAYGDMSSQPANQDTDIFNVLGGSTGNANSARNLSQTMVAQAQEGLDAGGDLTDRERRNAIQEARQASTARGRGRDFSAVVDEVENVANARRQREMDRRNFAGQVMNTQTGLMDRAMSQRQIVEGQRQQGLQMDRGYATQLVGLEQATAVDPFQAIINKPSGVTNQAGQAVYGNAYQGVGASPALYNPAQGVQFMADQQAQLNSYNSAFAGAQAQQSAGKSAMLGNIVGGVAGVGTSYLLGKI